MSSSYRFTSLSPYQYVINILLDYRVERKEEGREKGKYKKVLNFWRRKKNQK
jgi:hypothetical protein